MNIWKMIVLWKAWIFVSVFNSDVGGGAAECGHLSVPLPLIGAIQLCLPLAQVFFTHCCPQLNFGFRLVIMVDAKSVICGRRDEPDDRHWEI